MPIKQTKVDNKKISSKKSRKIESEGSISDFDSEFEEEIESENEKQQLISPEEKKLFLAQQYIEKLGIKYGQEDIDSVVKLLGIDSQINEKTNEIALDAKFDEPIELKLKKELCTDAVMSEDDSKIIVATKSGKVLIFDINKLDCPTSILSEKQINSVCFLINDKLIASAGNSKIISIWDIRESNEKAAFEFKGHSKSINTIRSYSEYLFSTGEDKSLVTWHVPNRYRQQVDFGHTDSVNCMDLISSKNILTAGDDSTVRYWNLEDKKHAIFHCNSSMDACTLLNKHGFVCGGLDQTLYLYSIGKKKALKKFEIKGQRSNWISACQIFKNTDLLAVGSDTGYIYIFRASMKDGGILEKIQDIPSEGVINSIFCSKSNKFMLATASKENRKGRWSTIQNFKPCVRIYPRSINF